MTVFEGHGTLSMHFVVFEITGVAVSVFPGEFAFSAHLALDEWAVVGSVLGFHLARDFVVHLEFSFVVTVVLF